MYSGNLVVVKLFVQSGMSVHTYDFVASFLPLRLPVILIGRGVEKTTPLVAAAAGGHLDVIKYLEGQGASFSTHNRVEATHWAVRNGHLEMVKYLAGQGTSIGRHYPYRSSWGTVPHLFPAAYGGHLDVAEYLVVQGVADVNQRGGFLNRSPAMHFAAWNGHLEMVKYLVGQGASITAEARGWAVARGHTAVVQYFDSLDDDDDDDDDDE